MKIMEGLEKNVHVSKQTTPPTPLNHACIKAAKKNHDMTQFRKCRQIYVHLQKHRSHNGFMGFQENPAKHKMQCMAAPAVCHEAKRLDMIAENMLQNDKLFSANIGFECFCLKNAV